MPVESHTVAGQLDDHIKTMGQGGERKTEFNGAYFQAEQA